ncbi:MAG: cytochrome c peroxidase [Bradymonadia bacterium]
MMCARASYAVLLCAGLLAGCLSHSERDNTPSPIEPAAARSTSIALLPDGVIVVTSPDDDAVVGLDAETLEELWRTSVEGEPTHVAFVEGVETDQAPLQHHLFVSLARGQQIAMYTFSSAREGPMASTGISSVCSGTYGILAHRVPWVFGAIHVTVTCPHDGLVLQRSVPDGWGIIKHTRVWYTEGRPMGLARNGPTLAWADFTGGQVHTLDLIDAFTNDMTPTQQLADVTGALPDGISASQMVALSPAGQGFTAVYQQVEHDSDRARPPEEGGYGSVVDDAPRIEPRLWGSSCEGRYTRFDGGLRVMSGPSDLAYASASDTLWVAHQYTDNVVALGCTPGADGLLPIKAVFKVGRGPRGLVVSPDGETAYVDVGFDHAVARLELPTAPVTDRVVYPTVERRRDLGPTDMSSEALKGRSLFHDALDIRLTPSGVVTCATCHPHGGEDGLSWFLHTETVERKLRRTPPVYNTKPGLEPFHWDGEFEDAATLTHDTILALMEGDGLLVDIDAIVAYMDELKPPPGDVRSVARGPGRMLFESQGCADCHRGDMGTDNIRHTVLEPSTDTDAQLMEVITPSLRGVRTRPPYLHDGRAKDLRAVLTTHNPDDRHGVTSTLSAEQIEQLLGYLKAF